MIGNSGSDKPKTCGLCSREMKKLETKGITTGPYYGCLKCDRG